MNKVKDWIRRHQIAAFFIITFAISWGLGFSWEAVLQHNQALLLPLAFASVCGPGLAGIIVSAIVNTQPKQGSRKTSWIAFLAAWLVATSVYLANAIFIEHISPSPVAIVLFAISVIPVAFILAAVYSRIPSVKNHRRRFSGCAACGAGPSWHWCSSRSWS